MVTAGNPNPNKISNQGGSKHDSWTWAKDIINRNMTSHFRLDLPQKWWCYKLEFSHDKFTDFTVFPWWTSENLKQHSAQCILDVIRGVLFIMAFCLSGAVEDQQIHVQHPPSSRRGCQNRSIETMTMCHLLLWQCWVLLLHDYPLPSMYGIFTYIYHTNQPNVGNKSIHGCYGLGLLGGGTVEMFALDSFTSFQLRL